MSDIVTVMLGFMSAGFVNATGGNNLVLSMIPLVLTGIALWYAGASLPASLLIVFTELGLLSILMNGGGDPLLGAGGDQGITYMLYLLVVAMTGYLIYHLFFKRAQMG